jgi:hypothetical protein
VTLFDGPTPLWHWVVRPGEYQLHVSPPFYMPKGRGRLRLESDGVVELDRLRKRFHGELRPASMLVRAICLRKAQPGERREGGVLAGNPGAGDASIR